MNKIVDLRSTSVEINPVHQFIEEGFDINAEDDVIIWFTSIADMKRYWKEYCEKLKLQIPLNQFTESMAMILGIKKDGIQVKDRFELWGRVRGWIGIRRKSVNDKIN